MNKNIFMRIKKVESRKIDADREGLEIGPFNKNQATITLENTLNRLASAESEYKFSFENDELVLTVLDVSTGSTEVHYLNLLLLSADLTQLEISTEFLNLYFKKFTVDTVLDSGVLQKFKTLEAKLTSAEAKVISPSHRLAIYNYSYYAINYHFNSFLRGDIEFLSKLTTQSGQDLQAIALFILSTVVITTNALNKLPLQLDVTEKKVVTTTTYRFQEHELKKNTHVNVLSGLEGAKLRGRDHFILNDLALQSTSYKKLSFIKDDQRVSVSEESKNMVIAIRYHAEFNRCIAAYSCYKDENEVLLMPGQISYKVLFNEGPFLLLDAKTTRTLVAKPDDNYMLQHALRSVAKIVYKEFKHSSKTDVDHALIMPGKPVLQRPNHGLAHAARQAKHIKDVLEFLLRHGNDEQAHKLLIKFANNKQYSDLIRVAAMFLAVGRENEKSPNEDENEYLRARWSSRSQFEHYIVQYYHSDLVADVELTKIYNFCRAVIQNLGSLSYLTEIESQPGTVEDRMLHKIIYHLLTTAHLLETPRFITFEESTPIINMRIFASKGGLIDEADVFAKRDFIALRELACDRIKQMGDRLIGKQNYAPEFVDISLSPAKCECILSLTSETPLLLLDRSVVKADAIESRLNETAFQLLYFLFYQSKNRLEQFGYFTKTGSRLLNASLQYLKTQPDLSGFEQVKEFIALMELYKNTCLARVRQPFSLLDAKKQLDFMRLTFTKQQESLVKRVATHYRALKNADPILFKLVALVDLYGGEYPAFMQENSKLYRDYSIVLTEYCRMKNIAAPVTKTHNIYLFQYQNQYNSKLASAAAEKTTHFVIQMEHVLFSQTIEPHKLDSWFAKNHLIFHSFGKSKVVHPGAIEFLQYLFSMPNLNISFFSRGLVDEAKDAVEQLLTTLPAKKNMDHHPKKYGYYTLDPHNGLLDLAVTRLPLADSFFMSHTVCIDYDSTVLHSSSHTNLVKVHLAYAFNFFNRLATLPANIMRMNHIFYLTGWIKALLLDNSKPIVERLGELMSKQSPGFDNCAALWKNKQYYLVGLAELKKINPTLEFYGANAAEYFTTDESVWSEQKILPLKNILTSSSMFPPLQSKSAQVLPGPVLTMQSANKPL
jgi:hypothetical protein